MILYCVRHGQTDFNKNDIIQGKEFDKLLNREGIEQVENIVPNLPDDFEVIFSSSLKRVLHSAKIISEATGKEIEIDDNLKELDFGSLAGKTWDDIPNGRELQKIGRNLKYDYREYEGESVEDVKNRIKTFLGFIKQSGYEKVLAVTSIGIIRLLYLMIENKKVVEIDNASIHTFEI